MSFKKTRSEMTKPHKRKEKGQKVIGEWKN